MKLLIALTFIAVFNIAYADNWAVLIAGSKGFYNYQPQPQPQPQNLIHYFKFILNSFIKLGKN